MLQLAEQDKRIRELDCPQQPLTISNIVLALLFAISSPILKRDIKKHIKMFIVSDKEIENAVNEIKEILLKTPLMIVETDDAIRLGVRPEYSPFVAVFKEQQPVRLSTASLETLAVIIYKQPVSRQEIEEIRQVDCEKTIDTLLIAKLIKPICNFKKKGSPFLYTITDECLFRFGAKNYQELIETLFQKNQV